MALTTISNADVSPSAAIAGTKISANLGAQDLIVNVSDLKVDHINHRVGVVNASPAYPLDVVGDLNITGTYRINGIPFSGGGTPGGTSGAVQFDNAGAFGGNAAKLFWDITNFRLGIGTNTPAYPLDVVGGMNITGNYFVGGVQLSSANLSDAGTLTAYMLKDASAAVDVSAATPPTAGQVLTATDATHATWQAASGGNSSGLLDTTGAVNVSASAAPIAGQILIATDPTHATWQSVGTSSQTRQDFTATGGQTNFVSLVPFVAGGVNCQVYVNGDLERLFDNYTESGTNTIVFNTGLTAGDNVTLLIISGGGVLINSVDALARVMAFMAQS